MNTLETEVLTLIGEDPDAPDVFVDTTAGMAPIRDSLNDALEEMALITGAAKETYALPLTADTIFYTIAASNYLWISDVWLQTQKRRLEQVDLVRLASGTPRWMEHTGTPEQYFPVGLKYVGVWPAPSTTTDMLMVTMAVCPERYTTGDDLLRMRENWKWAAVHYAVGEYYASRGDAKSAIYHHSQYLENMGLNVKYPYANERTMQLETVKQFIPRATE